MTTRTKAERLKQPRIPIPQFVSKPDMADTLRCSVDVISDWVEAGHFPKPWLYPGPGRQISLWRADHFAEFLEWGRWPDEAKNRVHGS